MAPEQERRLALLCTKPPEYIEATKCERRGRGFRFRLGGRGRQAASEALVSLLRPPTPPHTLHSSRTRPPPACLPLCLPAGT